MGFSCMGPCGFLKINVCYSLTGKAMAAHSSTLAWKIPWMEEPGRLQSLGLLIVGHDWATSLSRFTFMHRRRKWQLTPVFLPAESQGRGSLVGCRLWGCRVEHDWSDLATQCYTIWGCLDPRMHNLRKRWTTKGTHGFSCAGIAVPNHQLCN